MIHDLIQERLEKYNLSVSDFSELLIRLLDYGVICRDESQVEELLYDRFVQCEALVADYFSLLAMRLQHDSKFSFVRVYPPGAVVPGLADETNPPFNHGFRSRPSQQEIAVILVLRVEYDKALREGQIDEKGCVLLSLEALSIGLSNILKRSLPDSLPERRQLLRRLRQLRLIHFNSDELLEGDESWLRIRPAITSFVSDEVLQTLSGDVDPMDIVGEQGASEGDCVLVQENH